MSKFAQVVDDVIINAIEWDSKGDYPFAGTLVPWPDGAQIGWVKAGGTWANPNPIEPAKPKSVTIDAWRFWAVVNVENLKDQIDVAIAALPNATERAVAKARLDYSATYTRDDPLFNQLGAAIGLGPNNIDDLFAAAAKL